MDNRHLKRNYFISILIFFLWFRTMHYFGNENEPLTSDNIMLFMVSHLLNFVPFFILCIINTFLVFKVKIVKSMFLKILTDMSLSFIGLLAINLMFIGIGVMLGKTPVVAWVETGLLNFIVLLANEVVYYILSYRKAEESYKNSRIIVTQLEHNVLRSQVNPHFLFNSLNTLYSLTYIDSGKSREFILSLSKMYRYITANRDRHTVTLREELDFLHSYIEVLKMLYYESLDVELTGEEFVESQTLLPCSLQLLMENVTKHNVIKKGAEMHVRVAVTHYGITFSNQLRPKTVPDESNHEVGKESESTGVGLKYLTDLYSLHGKNVRFGLDGNRFVVELPYISLAKEEVPA